MSFLAPAKGQLNSNKLMPLWQSLHLGNAPGMPQKTKELVLPPVAAPLKDGAQPAKAIRKRASILDDDGVANVRSQTAGGY